MAAWIVMQAVPGDVQLLASFPAVSTYQLAAAAADAPIANRTANTAQWPRLFGLRGTDVVVVFVPVAVIILVAFRVSAGCGSRLARNSLFELARCFVDTLPPTALTPGREEGRKFEDALSPAGQTTRSCNFKSRVSKKRACAMGFSDQ